MTTRGEAPYQLMVKRTRIGIHTSSDKVITNNITRGLFPHHVTVEWAITADQNEIDNFTEKELQVARKKLRDRKAPGPDRVPPEVVKIIGNSTPELFLGITNRSRQ